MRIHGIQMNVPADFQKIPLFLYQMPLETSLDEVPDAAMPAVEVK